MLQRNNVLIINTWGYLLNATFNSFIIACLITLCIGPFSRVFPDSKEFSERVKRCQFRSGMKFINVDLSQNHSSIFWKRLHATFCFFYQRLWKSPVWPILCCFWQQWKCHNDSIGFFQKFYICLCMSLIPVVHFRILILWQDNDCSELLIVILFQKEFENEYSKSVFHSVLWEFPCDKRIVKSFHILIFPYYLQARKNVFGWQSLHMSNGGILYFVLVLNHIVRYTYILWLGFAFRQCCLVYLTQKLKLKMSAFKVHPYLKLVN